MSSDEDGKQKSPAATPQRSASRRQSIFRIPPPLKRLFDYFPLYTYPSNALPLSSPRAVDQHTLYIFATADEARFGAPSFNPTCLKWQTYLKFHDIAFRTAASNNHASPSGALPFLLPSRSAAVEAQTITVSALPSWIRKQISFGAAHEAEPPRAQTYHSLITSAVRLAYLYALYIDPYTFDNVAAPFYLHPSSSNTLVREALAYPLRKAAWEEITTAMYTEGSAVESIDSDLLLSQAQEAFLALETRLDGYRWFSEAFGEKSQSGGPGLLDAAIFSYTHVLLEHFGKEEQERPAGRLFAMVREREGLVSHRDRILGEYFQSDWKDR